MLADEVVSHAFSHGFHPDHTEQGWARRLTDRAEPVKLGEADEGANLVSDLLVVGRLVDPRHRSVAPTVVAPGG